MFALPNILLYVSGNVLLQLNGHYTKIPGLLENEGVGPDDFGSLACSGFRWLWQESLPEMNCIP